MMQAQYDLLEVLCVGLIGPNVPFFEFGIAITYSFGGDFKLVDLIGTHFQRSLGLLVKLIPLLVGKGGETVCCIWEVVILFVFEYFVNSAQWKEYTFGILEGELILEGDIFLKDVVPLSVISLSTINS